MNTFDTANMYSNGLSETYLGKAIKELYLPREEIVVMTKVCGRDCLPMDAQAVLITFRRFGGLLVKWVTRWCGTHLQPSLTTKGL